jgi:hypothetical protein
MLTGIIVMMMMMMIIIIMTKILANNTSNAFNTYSTKITVLGTSHITWK